MLPMNRQSGEKSCWRSLAGLGLVVLFAFILNIAGSSETLAHSAALHNSQMDRGAPAHTQPQPVLPQYQTSRDAALALSRAADQQIDCLGHPVEHDCACCPSDSSISSSAYVRPNDDSVWQTQTRPLQKIVQPFALRFGLGIRVLPRSSQRPSPQMTRQNTMQIQFVETIRLLL